MTDFRLVKATPEDAPQVALIMAEALGDDIMERCLANGNEIQTADRRRMELLRQVALHDDTLYSYRHCTLVRTADGQTAGGLIAYPGDDYLHRRRVTFSMVSELIRFDVDKMDPETQPQEFYLDSMAVWPQFRRQGIARMLMRHGIQTGLGMHRTVTLACAPDNDGAHRLYTSLGFRNNGSLFIFDEDYIRMELSPSPSQMTTRI